jgi:hypothetical protein
MVLICDSMPDLLRSIRIIEEWAVTSNMHVNKTKCSILEIPVIPKVMKRVLANRKQYQDYPVVSKYRYLGTMMDSSFRLDAHIEEIDRKMSWLTARLTPARLIKNIRFNLNLYKVLIEPLIALGIPFYFRIPKTDRGKYENYCRKLVKRFCLLPRSTPHAALDLLVEPPDYRFQRKIETQWFINRKREHLWASHLGEPDLRLFDRNKNRYGMVDMEKRDIIRLVVKV